MDYAVVDYSLKGLFTNYCLMSAVFGWLIAQILKIFTGIFRIREFSFRAMMFGTGGMPSSHSASVAGLCTSIGIRYGLASPLFAIAGLLCIIVMNDAVGVRRETGKQSKALNLILKNLFKDSHDHDKLDENFRELIGHTPLQVVCGVITGIVVAVLISFIPAFGVWA